METNSGIYIIISPTARVYIGQAFDLDVRKRNYENKKCTGQPKIYNSIKKYGWENHFFDVLEFCPIEKLNQRERFWQEENQCLGIYGLNCVLTDTSEKRKEFSLETRQKMSDAAIGKIISDETKRKIGLVWKGKKRGEFSKEHLKKLSDAKKGKTQSEELVAKRIEARKGYVHSEETKQKMSEKAFERKQIYRHTEESKLKIGAASKSRIRKPLSEETKNKISETLKNKNKCK
ncbi:MAG: NUMOD3 domain-containing DNA-binding protein [Bacteroidota bacterium]|nr:NUMOD3 domain-containing DNA-binding protein [Bacteroidota bacterium]